MISACLALEAVAAGFDARGRRANHGRSIGGSVASCVGNRSSRPKVISPEVMSPVTINFGGHESGSGDLTVIPRVSRSRAPYKDVATELFAWSGY